MVNRNMTTTLTDIKLALDSKYLRKGMFWDIIIL